jgi:hypothetical protein
MLQAYFLSLQPEEDFNLSHYNNLRLWTHNRGIHTRTDLWSVNRWLTAEEISTRTRSSRHVGRPQFYNLMGFLAAIPGIADSALVDADGWFWNLPKRVRGWHQKTQTWRALLIPKPPDWDQFNRRWQVNWEAPQLQTLWTQLWGGWSHPRTKFLAWRLLHFGFFYTISRCLMASLHSKLSHL